MTSGVTHDILFAAIQPYHKASGSTETNLPSSACSSPCM